MSRILIYLVLIYLMLITVLLFGAAGTLHWPAARRRAHRAVSAAPYAYVRHPMYAGALLTILSVPLLLGSWLGSRPGLASPCCWG